MPRLNSGSELFKYLTSVTKYILATGTFGDTTSTGAAAAGDTTLGVTAATNFANNDLAMIIGDGGTELVQVSGTPATTMPLARPIVTPQSPGARFVEAQAIALGHVAEEGVKFGGTYSLTPIKAATSRTAIAYLAEAAELTWEIPLLGWNNLNLQAAFAATEGELGSGTAAAPHAVLIGQSSVGTQGIMCLRASGVRHDGKNVEVDFLDATVEVNVNATIGAAGTPPALVMTGKCTSIIQRIWS